MYKSKIEFLILILTIMVLLISSVITSTAQEKFIMKVAHCMGGTPDVPHYYVARNLKDRIESLTDGRIEVQLFPSNTLGQDREVMEGAMNGTIEMGWPASAVLATVVPEVGVLDLPYIFKDVDHCFRVLDGAVGDELASLCLAKGIRIGGWGFAGARHIMTTKKPINTLGDIKGLKIRVMESPVYIAMLDAWGAIPTPLSWGEVYLGLTQGLVVGQETTINAALEAKHFDSIKYVALTSEILSARPLIISEIWFQKLPIDLQEAVLTATKEATLQMREEIIKFEDDYKKRTETEYNVAYTQPDLEPWIEVTRSIYPKFVDLVGGQEIIDKVLAIE